MDLIRKYATPKYLFLTLTVFFFLHLFVLSGYHIVDIPKLLKEKLKTPGFFIKPAECIPGQKLTITCPGGSTIVTSVCTCDTLGKSCYWQNTNNICPPECSGNDTQIETCLDNSTVATKTCSNEIWVSTGNTCPEC